jgi:hypothetical protein
MTETDTLKAHKPSPRMRSLFREAARNIVARDRSAQIKGLSQNTIGEIQNAMSRAFVLGQQALLDKRRSLKSPARIDWLDVSPRARETLRSMTWAFSQRIASIRGINNVVEIADEIEKYEMSGRTRWAIVVNGQLSDRSFADGSVASLLRLDLLRPLADKPSRYELTESGMELCREYWRRSDAGDPTLPIESVRSR